MLSREEEPIQIQSRDLEILRFCLEMKFSDIESLNEKFFVKGCDVMFAARKRVQKLESGGLLKSISIQTAGGRKYYFTTNKGYRELSKRSASTSIPNPVSKLSLATFEHDLGVLKIRMRLEHQGRASAWRSERLLKRVAHDTTLNLNRYFMPDAIFTSKQGKVCAFEFENVPKPEGQLREKVLKLKALMDAQDPIFEACLFVTSTDHLKNKIQRICSHFPNRFVVETQGEINKGQKNEK